MKKTSKLLKKLNHLMGLGDKADDKEVEKLRKVLKMLKAKQKKLTEDMESAEGKRERHRLQQQLEVIKRQREKGIAVYKSLREENAGK